MINIKWIQFSQKGLFLFVLNITCCKYLPKPSQAWLSALHASFGTPYASDPNPQQWSTLQSHLHWHYTLIHWADVFFPYYSMAWLYYDTQPLVSHSRSILTVIWWRMQCEKHYSRFCQLCTMCQKLFDRIRYLAEITMWRHRIVYRTLHIESYIAIAKASRTTRIRSERCISFLNGSQGWG